MATKHYVPAFIVALSLAATANAQVVRGVMTVTGAEMH